MQRVERRERWPAAVAWMGEFSLCTRLYAAGAGAVVGKRMHWLLELGSTLSGDLLSFSLCSWLSLSLCSFGWSPHTPPYQFFVRWFLCFYQNVFAHRDSRCVEVVRI